MAKDRKPKTNVIFTIVRLLAPVLWMTLIFYLSSEGHAGSSGRSLPLAEWFGLPEWLIRKAAHFFLYFILGVLVMQAVMTFKKLNCGKTTLLAIAICVLFAITDEWHQSWNPERSAQLTDILLDSAASIIGVIVLYYTYEKITHRRAHRPDKRRQV